MSLPRARFRSSYSAAFSVLMINKIDDALGRPAPSELGVLAAEPVYSGNQERAFARYIS
jgi:hypothetical protein